MARQPDDTGFAQRGDVRLAYAVYGDGPTTVLLMPTWSMVHSRFWKAQIPYLARHHRVLTFDGRGNGRSSTPQGAAAYADAEFVADAVAVMDATSTASAVLVALSAGAAWAVQMAARYPGRVRGLVAIGPSTGLAVQQPERQRYSWDERLEQTEGWAKYNKHYWLEGDFDDFRRFFFDQMFSEPHSTKPIEDCLEWSSGISAQTLADTTAARLGLEGAVRQPIESFCVDVRCPVLVVHGTDDRIQPDAAGARLAELTGGSLVLLEGAGHCPQGRDPVKVNLLIR
ncbi:alpha/beta fold hydrolase, partial [Ornithinimicrobium sp.]|uniref:alpha/beta fold hydrolase n=1 Tax=Ornithinimicrobium sp. TaxID=1977084 RepID=UPI003D9B8EFF